MARTKSHYRKFRDGGAVTPSAPLHIEVNSEASHVAADHATAHMLPALNRAVNVDVDVVQHDSGLSGHSPATAGDENDASVAFQRQIDALRKSEAAQRQRQAQQVPTSRAGRILEYRNAGFSDDQSQYFTALEQNPDLTHQAIMAAREQGGVDEGSQVFHDAVRHHFEQLSAGAPTVRTPPPEAPLEPSPRANEFFEAPASSRRSVGGMVSAPVSRNVPSTTYNERPGRVTLSAQEKELCRHTGQSEVDYARGKIQLEEDKRNGRYDH